MKRIIVLTAGLVSLICFVVFPSISSARSAPEQHIERPTPADFVSTTTTEVATTTTAVATTTTAVATTTLAATTTTVAKPTIAVDNRTPFAGSSVTLTAGGICAGATVTFSLSGTVLGTATANADGVASITVTLPKVAGTYTVVADSGPPCVASSSLSVTVSKLLPATGSHPTDWARAAFLLLVLGFGLSAIAGVRRRSSPPAA
jgi:hypothetical protein